MPMKYLVPGIFYLEVSLGKEYPSMAKFESVDAYIESFSGKTKTQLEQLRAIIHAMAPGCEELINYNIAAFALVEGGKRDQQIMIAGFTKHVGFYPHPTTIEHFWDQLDAYKKAKGSVQFPLDAPLPEALIRAMIRYRQALLNEQ